MTDKTTNNNKAAEPSKPNKQAATADNKNHSSTNDNKTATTAVNNTSKNSGNKTGWVAIALVIALGGGLYYQSHQQQLLQTQKIAALQHQITKMKVVLQGEQQQNINVINSELGKAETQLNQQQKSITSLQTAVSDLKGHSPNDWLLAEADYLVKMASRKLFLEHDVTSATLLLESADHRIAELNNPNLRKLRQALSNDIVTLKSLPRIDREGLVLRLTTLENTVDKLPLANAIVPKAEETKPEAVSDSINDWKTNLLTSLKSFSEHFITYRKREGNVTPLLSPQQDFYLQQNLKNKLETAIYAVYHEQGEVYHLSLTVAKKWVEQYYDMSSPLTQNFIDSLAQLDKKKVTANYPKELESQALISQQVNQILRNSVDSINQTQQVSNTAKEAKPETKPLVKEEKSAVSDLQSKSIKQAQPVSDNVTKPAEQAKTLTEEAK